MMKTFDICKNLRKMLANRATDIIISNPDIDFVLRDLQDLPKYLVEIGREEYTNIDISGLTKEQLIELDSQRLEGLFLIPLWILPFLSEKMEVTTWDNKEITIKEAKENMEVIGGCLLYGFKR